MSVLQDLYDSGIYVSVSSSRDGWSVGINDGEDKVTNDSLFLDWDTAEDWLIRKATRLYPESQFATEYGEPLSIEEALDIVGDLLGVKENR